MTTRTPRQVPPGESEPALARSVGVLGGWAVAASGVAATTSIAIGLGMLAGIVGVQLPVLLVIAFCRCWASPAPTRG
jgi:hypothetical protein